MYTLTHKLSLNICVTVATKTVEPYMSPIQIFFTFYQRILTTSPYSKFVVKNCEYIPKEYMVRMVHNTWFD